MLIIQILNYIYIWKKKLKVVSVWLLGLNIGIKAFRIHNLVLRLNSINVWEFLNFLGTKSQILGLKNRSDSSVFWFSKSNSLFLRKLWTLFNSSSVNFGTILILTLKNSVARTKNVKNLQIVLMRYYRIIFLEKLIKTRFIILENNSQSSLKNPIYSTV